jgi:hypothetical protein
LQFLLDQSGIPKIDKASINEVYYDEVPAKSTSDTPKPAEEGSEEKKQEEKKNEKNKKERSTVCIVKLMESYGLSQSLLTVNYLILF